LAVFPAVGPFQSDRGSPGTRVLVPAAIADVGQLPAELGFLGIDLAAWAARHDVLAAVTPNGARIDPDGDGLIEYDEPIRPPEIDDARSIRALPTVVGGLVGLAVVVGLSFSVSPSARSSGRFGPRRWRP
jgi:hypothetical protein